MIVRKQIAVGCFLLFVSVGTVSETVVIGTHDYLPYYTESAEGMMDRVYRAAFAEVGLKVETRFFPVKRGITELFWQNIDAYSPGELFIQEGKDKIYHVPTINVLVCWFYYQPYTAKVDIDNLQQYKAGIVTNSPMLEYYQKNNFNTVMLPTPLQMLRMLKVNRIQLYESSLITGLSLVGKHYYDEVNNFSFVIWGEVNVGLAFLKGKEKSEKLHKLYLKGLARVKEDGRFIRIMEDYWGKNNIPKQVLPDDLKHFGVDDFNQRQFYQYPRDINGKIIAMDIDP